MRVPTQRQKPKEAQVVSWTAPTSGWIANRNLAQPGARNPDGTAVSGAYILDNFVPTGTGARLRRGNTEHADISGDTIVSMFSYAYGGASRLFAADSTKISDVTTTPTDAITGQTSGDWVSVQFSTSDGPYLRLVNGADTPLVYDGTAFSTTPALTFPGDPGDPSPEDLNYVCAYQNRLFFIEKDSLDVWYLPVGQIGGELTKFPLGGVFEMGGSLLFCATWSNDSGAQGGLSEQIIFVTTEGEVAVYQGDNPGEASSWGKVGVYRIGRPLGKRAWVRAGADIVIATSTGLVPISAAVRVDYAALAPHAVSYPIEDVWSEAVRRRPGLGWMAAIWPFQQIAIIAPPFSQSLPVESFVVNLRTGAWCRFTGWDIRSMAVFGDRLFFGTVDGRVMEAMSGGQDDGAPYTGVYLPLFDDFGTPANIKIMRSGRAFLRSRVDLDVALAGHSDFNTELPPPPEAPLIGESGLWGSATWGSSTWGDESDLITVRYWQTVNASDTTLSMSLQVTSDDLVPLDVEIIRLDATIVGGDILTR